MRDKNLRENLKIKPENFKERMEKRLDAIELRARNRMLNSALFTTALSIPIAITHFSNTQFTTKEPYSDGTIHGLMYDEGSLLDDIVTGSGYAVAAGVLFFLARGMKDKIDVLLAQKDLEKGTKRSVSDAKGVIYKKADAFGVNIKDSSYYDDSIKSSRENIKVYREEEEKIGQKSNSDGIFIAPLASKEDQHDAWKKSRERVNNEKSGLL
jgi:hypothetical protein